MTMPDYLLKVADGLLGDGSTQTMGRRAVSTAYYAVFHALAENCADQLLSGAADKASEEYVRVYRALDHGSLKVAFRSAPLKDLEAVEGIGNRIVELQSERIRADYMPHKKGMYTRRQCLDLLQSARLAVKAIAELEADVKRALAVHLIFKTRPQ